MVGEKEVAKIVQKQFESLLNDLDKYDLSFETKMKIYKTISGSIHKRVIDDSIKYGTTISEQENVVEEKEYTDYEEHYIESYYSYFERQGSTDFITLAEMSDKELELVAEAQRRYEQAHKQDIR